MRIISGRQVEAAACKPYNTLEGCYSGFLLPDIHYIPLKRFFNIDEALEKFEDESFCLLLCAYDLVSQRLLMSVL